MGEATTRTFDAPSAPDDQWTRSVNVSPTTPAYLAPGMPMHAPAASTQGLEKSRHKWAIVALSSLVVILLITLAAVFYTRSRIEPSSYEEPPTGTGPPQLEVPAPPDLPPPPPAPPVPGGAGPTVKADLRYPGAETLEEIDAGPGVMVIRLRTKDPAAEVAKWYESKLKDKKVIKLPNDSTIISSGSTSIIIKSEADGTRIIVTGAGLN